LQRRQNSDCANGHDLPYLKAIFTDTPDDNQDKNKR
jgi:hypothetical protein